MIRGGLKIEGCKIEGLLYSIKASNAPAIMYILLQTRILCGVGLGFFYFLTELA